jgi:hypothetical protein
MVGQGFANCLVDLANGVKLFASLICKAATEAGMIQDLPLGEALRLVAFDGMVQVRITAS